VVKGGSAWHYDGVAPIRTYENNDTLRFMFLVFGPQDILYSVYTVLYIMCHELVTWRRDYYYPGGNMSKL
jgi:hypothetical protein